MQQPTPTLIIYKFDGVVSLLGRHRKLELGRLGIVRAVLLATMALAKASAAPHTHNISAELEAANCLWRRRRRRLGGSSLSCAFGVCELEAATATATARKQEQDHHHRRRRRHRT